MLIKKYQRGILLLIGAAMIGTAMIGCDRSKTSDKEDSKTFTKGINEDDIRDNRLKKLVNKWNQSLNLRDPEMSASLFAPMVFFYTKELPSEEVLKLRMKRVNSDPTWNQEIISSITCEEMDNGDVKTTFTKQSNSDKGSKTYRAYLVWRQIDGEWLIVKESDNTTDQNVEKHKKIDAIPKNAISGDFDGDGIVDHLWIDGKFDSDGRSVGKIRLKSDNPKLEGLTWEAGYGAFIENLGLLDDSGADFLGVVPEYDSNWEKFYTYRFRNGKWKEAVRPFTIWEGDENYRRVIPPRSGRKGYVGIIYNNMDVDNIDNIGEVLYTEEKLIN